MPFCLFRRLILLCRDEVLHLEVSDSTLELTSLLQGEVESLYIVMLLFVANPFLHTLEIALELAIYIETSSVIATLDADIMALTLLYIIVEVIEIAIAREAHTTIYGACEVELGHVI